jgi:hypothetical protein
MGPRPGDVGPRRAVTYVPTAALLARTRALDPGFDEALRHGEDVDLVWRLVGQGHRVRYDPTVTVAHAAPATLRGRLDRRRRYGTSAGPLARRHPGHLAPAVLRPVPTAAALLMLTGHGKAAAATALAPAVPLARTLHRLGASGTLAPRLTTAAVLQTLAGLGRAATLAAAPALLAGLAHPRTRRAAGILLLAPALPEWRCGGDLAAGLAYDIGVWQGAIRSRTIAPLTPALRRSEPRL